MTVSTSIYYSTNFVATPTYHGTHLANPVSYPAWLSPHPPIMALTLLILSPTPPICPVSLSHAHTHCGDGVYCCNMSITVSGQYCCTVILMISLGLILSVLNINIAQARRPVPPCLELVSMGLTLTYVLIPTTICVFRSVLLCSYTNDIYGHLIIYNEYKYFPIQEKGPSLHRNCKYW